MKYVLALALLLGGFSPVSAQTPDGCGPTDKVLSAIVHGPYKENTVPFIGALGDQGDLGTVVVWVNPETGTWTITVAPAAANGALTCMKASGISGRAGGPNDTPPAGQPM